MYETGNPNPAGQLIFEGPLWCHSGKRMLCGSTVFHEQPCEGDSVPKIVETEDLVPIFLNHLWKGCLSQIKGRDYITYIFKQLHRALEISQYNPWDHSGKKEKRLWDSAVCCLIFVFHKKSHLKKNFEDWKYPHYVIFKVFAAIQLQSFD